MKEVCHWGVGFDVSEAHDKPGVALRRQRQVDLCEFEANWAYMASKFRDSQDYIERPCLKQINKQTNTMLSKMGLLQSRPSAPYMCS